MASLFQYPASNTTGSDPDSIVIPNVSGGPIKLPIDVAPTVAAVNISGLPSGAILTDHYTMREIVNGGTVPYDAYAPLAITDGSIMLSPDELSVLTLSGITLAPGASLPVTVTAIADSPSTSSVQSPPNNSVPPQPADVTLFPEDGASERAIGSTGAEAATYDTAGLADLSTGQLQAYAKVMGEVVSPPDPAWGSGADQTNARMADTITIVAPAGYTSPIPVSGSASPQPISNYFP